MSVGNQMFVFHIRVAVISKAVVEGDMKKLENLGPQYFVCYTHAGDRYNR